MAPHAIYESPVDAHANISQLKSKVVTSHVELEVEPKPPTADDYMYDFKYNHALPTSDVLGTEVPDDCNAQHEAERSVARLSQVMAAGDASGFTEMFLDYGECNGVSIASVD